MYYKTNLISYLFFEKLNGKIRTTLNDQIIVKKDSTGIREITTNMYIPAIKQEEINPNIEFFILKDSLTHENLAKAKEVKDYQIQFNMNMHPVISQMLLSSIKKKQKEYTDEEPIVTIEKVRKLTNKTK
jgi:hypothetical protein